MTKNKLLVLAAIASATTLAACNSGSSSNTGNNTNMTGLYCFANTQTPTTFTALIYSDSYPSLKVESDLNMIDYVGNGSTAGLYNAAYSFVGTGILFGLPIESANKFNVLYTTTNNSGKQAIFNFSLSLLNESHIALAESSTTGIYLTNASTGGRLNISEATLEGSTNESITFLAHYSIESHLFIPSTGLVNESGTIKYNCIIESGTATGNI